MQLLFRFSELLRMTTESFTRG